MLDDKQDECRKAFEAWIYPRIGNTALTLSEGQYNDVAYVRIQDQWEIWQAAWDRRQPEAGKPGEVSINDDYILYAIKDAIEDCGDDGHGIRRSGYCFSVNEAAVAAMQVIRPYLRQYTPNPDESTDQQIPSHIKERLARGECPNCGEFIGTMAASEMFHKCMVKPYTKAEPASEGATKEKVGDYEAVQVMISDWEPTRIVEASIKELMADAYESLRQAGYAIIKLKPNHNHGDNT